MLGKNVPANRRVGVKKVFEALKGIFNSEGGNTNHFCFLIHETDVNPLSYLVFSCYHRSGGFH